MIIKITQFHINSRKLILILKHQRKVKRSEDMLYKMDIYIYPCYSSSVKKQVYLTKHVNQYLDDDQGQNNLMNASLGSIKSYK